MDGLNRNGSVAYRAVRQSSPGLWSWLGLLLLTASLLLAVQFRGSIIEQMEYKEWDSASIATLNVVILGFSVAFAVAGAVAAWRVWWTFRLIGTTALGIPNVTAAVVAGLRAGQVWGWSTVSRPMATAFTRFSHLAGRYLAYSAKASWLIASFTLVSIIKRMEQLSKFVFTTAYKLWAAVVIPTGATFHGYSRLAGRALAFVVMGFWFAIFTPLFLLVVGALNLFREFFSGVRRVWAAFSGPVGEATAAFFYLAVRALALFAIGIWHDNPFAIPNAPGVSVEQIEAARVVEEYLRSDEVQQGFMQSGFRPGIYVLPKDILTPSRGLDLREPQEFLGRVTAETARAIQMAWEEERR